MAAPKVNGRLRLTGVHQKPPASLVIYLNHLKCLNKLICLYLKTIYVLFRLIDIDQHYTKQVLLINFKKHMKHFLFLFRGVYPLSHLVLRPSLNSKHIVMKYQNLIL